MGHVPRAERHVPVHGAVHLRADGKPTWYTAEMVQGRSQLVHRPAVRDDRHVLRQPWQGVNGTQVGTASFKPTDIYHATLTYSLDGGPTVTKTVSGRR